MMKRLFALLVLLPLLAAGGGQYTIPRATGAVAIPATVTWTLVQNLNNFTCTSYACSITGVTTTAGDVLIIASGIKTSTAAPTFGSVSGDGTWTHDGACLSGRTSTNYYYVDCAYRLVATGGTGQTLTYTWTANGGTAINQDIELYEVRRSTGSATFDTLAVTTSLACTSCTGPTLTLAGTSEYVVEFGIFNSTISALGAPWTNPADTDNTRYRSFNGALNQSSGAAVTWVQGSSTVAVMTALAIK